MNNVVMRAAVTFVSPDAAAVAMVPEGVSDLEAGLQVTALAQVSLVTEDGGQVLSSMFMTRDELARAVVELRAVYEAMDQCTQAVDRGWSRYRDAIRSRVAREEVGGGG